MADTENTPPSGHILDYISGKPVRATPEETQAVQVFARRLVEEYKYPKSVITTRPQFRVRATPSGSSSKGYPVDIAVFSSDQKLEEEAFILVECKRKTRQDGEKQLKTYLSLSSAQIGVWFNGDNHLYLQKKLKKNGSIDWIELPTIPRWGQSVDDIGRLTKSQLVPPSNLKATFQDIRNHLAGSTVGITLDQDLAQEIMNLLFCKIYDELDAEPDDLPKFRTSVDESASIVAARINALFKAVKEEYPDVFEPNEKIRLDPDSIRYVVGELQNSLITGASRDAIGDAFEVFIGPAIRGKEGQFFTPRNVVQLVVRLLDPKPGEMIIDPACGSGGFLIVALEYVWAQIEREAKKKKWTPAQLEGKRRDVAMRCFRGIDKDAFLTKVTKAYMAIIGDGRGGIYCFDSLEQFSAFPPMASESIKPGSFDVVLANPPFGSKIKYKGTNKLAQYALAAEWKKPKDEQGDWEKTTTLRKHMPPQVLFIERCVQLLRKGGRLGVVLPESIFGMPKYGYVVKWLLENFTLHCFISLPEEIFQPDTHAKTCVLILENTRPPHDYPVHMAIADWCGHDSRGNPTLRVNEEGKEILLDDLPKIAEQLHPKIRWGRDV